MYEMPHIHIGVKKLEECIDDQLRKLVQAGSGGVYAVDKIEKTLVPVVIDHQGRVHYPAGLGSGQIDNECKYPESG